MAMMDNYYKTVLHRPLRVTGVFLCVWVGRTLPDIGTNKSDESIIMLRIVCHEAPL